MLNKKDLQRENILLLFMQKGNLEFLITIFFVSFLTIMGIFMSHYNSDKFIGRNRIIETVIKPTKHTDKAIAVGINKTIISTFN